MSFDRYDTDYHLTPKGWITGTAYYYDQPQGEVLIPKDRVLTVRERTTQILASVRAA